MQFESTNVFEKELATVNIFKKYGWREDIYKVFGEMLDFSSDDMKTEPIVLNIHQLTLIAGNLCSYHDPTDVKDWLIEACKIAIPITPIDPEMKKHGVGIHVPVSSRIPERLFDCFDENRIKNDPENRNGRRTILQELKFWQGKLQCQCQLHRYRRRARRQEAEDWL